MARLAACLVLVCGLIARLHVVSAQATNHYLTNMPPPGSVVSGYMFPTYPDKKFPAGKMADVVLGLRNEGSETYNITMIAGSLNSPVDFNVHVQNFTQMGYAEVLEPGKELSLEYKFYPDPRLEPRDFVVALTAFYVDSKGNWHSSTFFNETINIVEVKKLIDWELLFLIVLFAVGIAGLAYLGLTYLLSLGWVKSSKRRARSSRSSADRNVSMSAEDQQDWVKGTPYDSFVKRNARAATRRTK